MPPKTEKLIYAGDGPVRVDRFLTEHFSTFSRSYVQELILQGVVRVKGLPARKGQVLVCGDVVTIEPFVRPEERRIEANPSISIHIVWQSPDILVLDKPAGIPTHPNDYADKNTLANAVLALFPEISEVGEDRLRPGVVHRLDTDTSGLLLVARTQKAFKAVRKLFDERRVKKTYLALVLGDLEASGEVTTPLGHHPKNPRKMVAALPGVEVRSKLREAKTLYEPVERLGSYTLLRVRTLTGRMHQVRVHLSSIGHPLAGDRLYQSPQERGRDPLPLRRHFLHACELTLPLFDDNHMKTFESTLPPELEQILRDTRMNPNSR